MSKFWQVVRYTYLSKVRQRVFIITTVIFAIVALVFANLDGIIEKVIDDDKKEEKAAQVLVVSDEATASFLQVQLKEQIKLTVKAKEPKDSVRQLREGLYEAVLIVERDEAELPKAVLKVPDLIASDVIQPLEMALQAWKGQVVTAKLGLTAEQLQQVTAPVAVEKIAVNKEAKTEEELDTARAIVYALVFFIYISVLMFGTMIAMDVATEKSSRVMEIIISSVSPVQHMVAKIVGILAVAVTQLALLVAIMYGSKGWIGTGQMELFSLHGLTPKIAIYAIVFYLLGFLLFGTMYAFLGSLVSRVEDVQQTTGPMTMLMVVGFFIAITGLSSPDAFYVKVTSFIPFFAPMVMFLRIGIGHVALWEIVVSLTLLISLIAGLAFIGGRIYRGGVLMYGAKMSFWKGIRQALNQGR